jgi:hypothetical protein
MKRPPFFAIFASLFLAACEEPRTRERHAEEVPEALAPSPPPAPIDSAGAPSLAATAPANEAVAVPSVPAPAPAEEEQDKEPELPEFSISLSGDRILVSGALRSRLQVDRILEDLAREFPDHKLESNLEVEYHRIAVGWPNRVSADFLIDYLQSIESPRITYREGIVTLEGKAPDPRTHREISEVAIEIFADPHTEDMKNLIVAEGDASPGRGKGGEKGKGGGKGEAPRPPRDGGEEPL